MKTDYSERLWQLRDEIKKNYNETITRVKQGDLSIYLHACYSANIPLMQEAHRIFGDDKKGLVGFITSKQSEIGNEDRSIKETHDTATASISFALCDIDTSIKTTVPNLSKLVTKPVRDFYNQKGTSSKPKSTLSPTSAVFIPASQRLKSDNAQESVPPSKSNLSPTSAVFIPTSQRLKSDNAQEFVQSAASNKQKHTFSRVAGYMPVPSDSGRLSQLNGEIYDHKIHTKSNLSPSQKIIQRNSPLSQLGGKKFILKKDGRTLLPEGRQIVGAERINKNPNGQTIVR